MRKHIVSCFRFLFPVMFLCVSAYAFAQETPGPTQEQKNSFTQTLSPEKKKEFLKLSPQDQNRVVLDGLSISGLANDEKQSMSTDADGVTSCFNYYSFGSVQVDAESTLSQTLPGLPVVFSGMIKNSNPYPVVDGSVYVKIVKTSGAKTADVQKNGYPVVDEFFAKENISLAGKKEASFSFEWKVPAYLPKGEYEAQFFFMTGKRFNLLGLSFTDDITGNKAPFSVGGDTQETVAFDKNSVTLNGKPFLFATPPSHFTKEENVQAKVMLVNPTSQNQTVNLTWTLSNWSGEREENVLDQKMETLLLKPKEKKSLAYTATSDKAKGTVSFLKAEAESRGVKSFLNIRFVRDGFDEMRINFPGVMKYPLKEGEKNTVFSCVHATNAPIVSDGELMLTLKDASGDVVDTYTYQGAVTGSMMGIKHEFTPKETSSDFTLEATLKQNGLVVETYSARYNCKDIDPSLCEKKTGGIFSVSSENGSGRVFGGMQIFAAAVAVAVVLMILWYVAKGGKGIAILLFFGFSVFMALAPTITEAKSAVWNGVYQGILYRKALNSDYVNLNPSSGGAFSVCSRDGLVATSVSSAQTVSLVSGAGVSLTGYYKKSTSTSSSTSSFFSSLTSLLSGGVTGGTSCPSKDYIVSDSLVSLVKDNASASVVRVSGLNIEAKDSGNESLTITYDDKKGIKETIHLKVTVVDTVIDSTVRALGNPNVSVTYNAIVSDSTGANAVLLNDGANIPVGTKLKFSPVPHKNTDISWFGTGYNEDSPYGHWVSFALKPQGSMCVSENLVSYGIYSPFSVDQPNVSFRHSGTAQLSCDAIGSECVVTSPGTIQSQVVFENTYGKFYWARGNEIKTTIYGGNTITYMTGCEEVSVPLTTSQGKAYLFQVPEVFVPFSLTAVSSSNPPTPPTITGPVTGVINQSYPFIFGGSIDPDGDMIRYEVDWNMDGIVDQLLPGTGYTASGSSQSGPYTWASLGSKAFQAKACDNQGACSGWTQHAIVISNTIIAEEPPVLNFSADSTSLIPGNSGTTLRWTVMNVNGCTASGNWNGAKDFTPVTEHSELTGPLASGSYTYTMTCTASSGSGSITKSVTISVGSVADTCTYITATCNASNCGKTVSNTKFCTQGGVAHSCDTITVSCSGSSTTKCPACSSVYKEVAP